MHGTLQPTGLDGCSSPANGSQASVSFTSIVATPAQSLVDQLVLQHSSCQLDEHSTFQIFKLTLQLWHLD